MYYLSKFPDGHDQRYDEQKNKSGRTYFSVERNAAVVDENNSWSDEAKTSSTLENVRRPKICIRQTNYFPRRRKLFEVDLSL